MIGISRLYCGSPEASDSLRYAPTTRCARGKANGPRPPVVVWNATRRCNLRCAHCYSASTSEAAADELTASEAAGMIDGLAGFGVPVLLISGGEPLMRPDLAELVARAHRAGLRTVVSTNGTLATEPLAAALAEVGLDYAGVSLDGAAGANDAIRGVPGAFEAALAGLRHFRDAGVKVGLRFTMTRRNAGEIPTVFDILQREGVPRACFYHLVAAGRGAGMAGEALDHAATRAALDAIIDGTAALHASGRPVEVLTVDNHADGPYLVLRLRRDHPARAERALALLRRQGGNASGERIGCVSWNGEVLPDQFWRTRVLGNVRRRPFREIWSDPAQPLLAALRDRKRHLKCRCLRCRWLDVCNGNLRARAEAATGDPWGDDPACYLTDEEIAP